MAYKPRIESNNLDLTSILSTIDELPDAGASVETCTVVLNIMAYVENPELGNFWALCYSDGVFYPRDLSGEISLAAAPPEEELYTTTHTISDVVRHSVLAINSGNPNIGTAQVTDVSGAVKVADNYSGIQAYIITAENGSTAVIGYIF